MSLDETSALDWRVQAEAALEDLRQSSQVWANLPVAERLRLLRECRVRVVRQAEAWADLGARHKLLPIHDPRAGEEWMSGPYAMLAGIDGYTRTLRQLSGKRFLRDKPVRNLPNGQLSVTVTPTETWDYVLWSGTRLDVWLRPGETRESLKSAAASAYSTPADDRPGAVSLVLGAGNISSIAPLDVLHKLFAEHQVVLLKLNPVNDYLKPVFDDVFAPFIEAGFVRLLTGGADVGAWAATHDLIDTIHITGSRESHDRIVWGPPEERASRKAAGTPVNTRPITSELGGVSPTIVVPGPWSEADLAFQAEHIALQKLHNSGFNCVAAQVLVMSEGWRKSEPLLTAVKRALSQNARAAYYPGAEERLAEFADLSPNADRVERRQGPAVVLNDLDDAENLSEMEVFGPGMSVHKIPEKDPIRFLKSAILMANHRLDGTLGANILIHPKTLREIGRDHFEALITEMRYGLIAVNAWTGTTFVLPEAPWGAFPGHTLEAVGSGIGKVHNTMMLHNTERAVLWGAFAPFPRAVRHGEFGLLGKPPWFPSHRSQLSVARALFRFRARPGLGGLLRIVLALLHR